MCFVVQIGGLLGDREVLTISPLECLHLTEETALQEHDQVVPIIGHKVHLPLLNEVHVSWWIILTVDDLGGLHFEEVEVREEGRCEIVIDLEDEDRILNVLVTDQEQLIADLRG